MAAEHANDASGAGIKKATHWVAINAGHTFLAVFQPAWPERPQSRCKSAYNLRQILGSRLQSVNLAGQHLTDTSIFGKFI
ncbi:hypothetical protein [Halomonas shantousis]